MATDRLKVYNGALLLIGKRRIASLSVNEEGRRLLDDWWEDGAVEYCLEQAFWKFATRSAMLDYDTALVPEFGYRRGFVKADDWVNTSAVCQDEFYKVPLLRYQDEQGVIWSDLDRIYVRWISNHVDWGLDLSRWPTSFTNYVKTYLAGKIVLKATGSAEMDREFNKDGGKVDRALSDAKNSDAQADPPKFAPPSNWVLSRRGMKSQWRDGGSRRNLIG